MNLYRETGSFWVWFWRVLRAYWSVRAATTAGLIVTSALANILKIITFFLPLKIILLAGSTGVPRYLPFVDPDYKSEWIYGLGAATVTCYVSTILLEKLATRLSERGSSAVTQISSELMVLNDQHSVAGQQYATICKVCASLLFIVLGGVALGFLNPPVLGIMVVFVVLQFLLSSWAMRGDEVIPGKFKGYVEGNLNGYLQVLSTTNFFAGFMVLLIPFLTGAGGNILIALLTFLILRQILGAVSNVATTAVRLARNKHRVDALVFREAQFTRPEQRPSRTLRELFHKSNRRQRGARALEEAGITGDVEAFWQDPNGGTIKTLLLVARGGPDEGEGSRCFQLQIYPKTSLRLLENEAFLFRHLPRRDLHAPEVLSRFSEGPFECQICTYGEGRALSSEEFEDWQPRLMRTLWSCPLPPRLVEAYTASQPLLHQRLNESFIERMRIAVDSDEEAELLDSFQGVLPELWRRLERLPLYVHNPELRAAITVAAGEDSVLVMHWGRWSLEPLGGGVAAVKDQGALIKLLPDLPGLRSDVREPVEAADVALAGLCQTLEIHMNKECYKAALGVVSEILEAVHSTAQPAKVA